MMGDIRDCIPETPPRKAGQQTPKESPIIGHKVVQLGANYFNTVLNDLGARWVRVECDMAVEIRVNNVLVTSGILQHPTTSAPPERLYFPDSTVSPTFHQTPLSFEYQGEIDRLEFTLHEGEPFPWDVDLRALIHVFYSSDKNVRVVPGRPHYYVYEVTKTAGWIPVTRVPINDLCLNSFLGPAPADSYFPIEIEVTGIGIENPIAFAGFDVTRQSLLWRDAADANTIREFVRVSQNVGGGTNQSFHTQLAPPVRIPYIALAQSVVGAPLIPQLYMELRHNGAGPFPEDLIAYINYRVVG